MGKGIRPRRKLSGGKGKDSKRRKGNRGKNKRVLEGTTDERWRDKEIKRRMKECVE